MLVPEARRSLRSQPEQAPAAWIDQPTDHRHSWWGPCSGCTCSGVCTGHGPSTAWVQSALLPAPNTVAP